MSGGPRILHIDIETLPIVGRVWQMWEANVLGYPIRNTIICCFSAKWHKGTQITRALPDYKGYRAGKLDDGKLVADLWELLNEADIIVAQNGDRFDLRKINARLIKHGHNPPAPYRTVDTLKTSRSVFGFDSNKLNDVCEFLGIGQKFHTGGFTLWEGCEAGDEKAWARMRTYNAQDVRLLEKLYLRLLPWMKNHPGVGGAEACPKCGSGRLQARGLSVGKTTTYQRMQCQACGGWCRGTKNLRKVKPLVNV